MNRGFSLLELLITVALIAMLAGLALTLPGRNRQRLVLENAMRRLRVGLERGRLAAERDRRPCGLRLASAGWLAPLPGSLPVCRGAALPLTEFDNGDALIVRTNLPELLRFSANGLVLDGGIVVVGHLQLPQQRCLVLGMPLGITRTGRYVGDPADALSSADCRPSDDA